LGAQSTARIATASSSCRLAGNRPERCRAQEREDVLEVGRGARCSAKSRRVERAASCSEEEDAPEPAADLEPTRMKVSVRNAVAGDVENRPQKECC
jgi:hypothetical protein